MGIKQLKSEYNPTPYQRRDRQGTHIHKDLRAEQAAEYLRKYQWGKDGMEQEEHNRSNTYIHDSIEDYNMNPITVEEILLVCKKFKRKKAPGPDELPMEICKEMELEAIEEIRSILNLWWEEESIPTETLRARVVMIYKKGDTSKYENYKPISLLNSMYKIYTAIVQKRLSAKLDKHLQKTQYGFRKSKSTSDALHIIRRIAEYRE